MEKYFANIHRRHAIAMAPVSIRMNCIQPELNKAFSHQTMILHGVCFIVIMLTISVAETSMNMQN